MRSTCLLLTGLLHCTTLFTAASASWSVPRYVEAIVGQAAVLQCHSADELMARLGPVRGNHAVTQVRWTRNARVVAQYTKLSDSVEWWSPPRYDFDRSNFSLTIRSAESADNAHYECHVNASESGSELDIAPPDTIHFRVATLPARPPAPQVSSFTSRSVTLGWAQADDGSIADAPVVQYHVIVSAGATPNRKNHKVVTVLASEAASCVVSSLSPYTTYTFQIQAENLAGKSPVSPASAPIRTKGEAPVAAPSLQHIYNASNHSLVVTWSHPPFSQLHGPLVGYRILAHNLNNGQRAEYYIAQPDVTSYVINSVDVYTRYSISIAADNNFGFGPHDTQQVTTAEALPTTAPVLTGTRVLTGAENSQSRAVHLKWAPPARPNGLITVYVLQYQLVTSETAEADTTAVETVTLSGAVTEYTLEHLAPYRDYRLWLQAGNSVGRSPNTQPTVVCTDTAAPSEPVVVAYGVPAEDWLLLQWSAPLTVYRAVDVYQVQVRLYADDDLLQRQHVLNTTHQFLRVPAERCVRVLLQVAAVTASVIDPAVQYVGPPSATHAFMIDVEPNASSANTRPVVTLYTSLCGEQYVIASQTNKHHIGASPADKQRRSVDSLSVVCSPSLLLAHPDTYAIRSKRMGPVLLGTLGLCLALFALILVGLMFAYMLYKRTYRADKLAWVQSLGYSPQPYVPYDDQGLPAVPVSQFEHYVSVRHANADVDFLNEYEKIESHSRTIEEDGVVTSHYSLLPFNRPKNRYINILAYDHTRVILKSNQTPGADYINANYVDGYQRPRAYIATQGPLPHTFVDFWRMVWEQRCGVVVMITNVVERGRKKCDQYWPSEGTETYGGHFQLRLLNENATAYYVQRVFALRNLKCMPRPAERVIFHYHYTHWPDHGVPSNPLPVLNFIRKSSEANRDTCAGPVVVHCSAGVGRSGTYIVVDSMLHQIRERCSINVHAFLRHIRQQRNFLVQTEEQYIFCHDVLLAAIQSGVTEIASTNLGFYIEHMLGEVDTHTKRTLLQHQYDLVTAPVKEHAQQQVSQQPENLNLNRQPTLIPMDDGRVSLDNHYINASFLQGYNRQDEFIITQSPTEQSTEAFWHLVWQYNVRVIVLLTDIMSASATLPDQQSFAQFWPDAIWEQATVDYGQFRVQFVSEWLAETWQCTHLLLSSKDQDFQLCCKLIHAPHWPAVCQPKDTIWDLVRCVARLQQDEAQGNNGPSPIVVIDKYGGNVAGTFCALSALAQQLEQDSSVDVYTLARLYHTRRPNIWPTLVNYQLLYDAVRHLLRDDGSTEMTCDSSAGGSDDGGLTEVVASLPQAHSAPLKLNTLVVMHENGCMTRSLIGRDVTL